MPKSEQIGHEYYANYETCRNRVFDLYDPDELQNEDVNLSYKNAFKKGKVKNDKQN